MKNFIIGICILLTLFLSGCAKNYIGLTDKGYDGLYFGEKKDGIRHGQGEMIWTDGTVYKGEWQNWEPHGQGKITDPDKRKRTLRDGGFFRNHLHLNGWNHLD